MSNALTVANRQYSLDATMAPADAACPLAGKADIAGDGPDTFRVTFSSRAGGLYTVSSLGTALFKCTCSVGINLLPCKHYAAALFAYVLHCGFSGGYQQFEKQAALCLGTFFGTRAGCSFGAGPAMLFQQLQIHSGSEAAPAPAQRSQPASPEATAARSAVRPVQLVPRLQPAALQSDVHQSPAPSSSPPQQTQQQQTAQPSEQLPSELLPSERQRFAAPLPHLQGTPPPSPTLLAPSALPHLASLPPLLRLQPVPQPQTVAMAPPRHSQAAAPGLRQVHGAEGPRLQSWQHGHQVEQRQQPVAQNPPQRQCQPTSLPQTCVLAVAPASGAVPACMSSVSSAAAREHCVRVIAAGAQAVLPRSPSPGLQSVALQLSSDAWARSCTGQPISLSALVLQAAHNVQVVPYLCRFCAQATLVALSQLSSTCIGDPAPLMIATSQSAALAAMPQIAASEALAAPLSHSSIEHCSAVVCQVCMRIAAALCSSIAAACVDTMLHVQCAAPRPQFAPLPGAAGTVAAVLQSAEHAVCTTPHVGAAATPAASRPSARAIGASAPASAAGARPNADSELDPYSTPTQPACQLEGRDADAVTLTPSSRFCATGGATGLGPLALYAQALSSAPSPIRRQGHTQLQEYLSRQATHFASVDPASIPACALPEVLGSKAPLGERRHQPRRLTVGGVPAAKAPQPRACPIQPIQRVKTSRNKQKAPKGFRERRERNYEKNAARSTAGRAGAGKRRRTSQPAAQATSTPASARHSADASLVAAAPCPLPKAGLPVASPASARACGLVSAPRHGLPPSAMPSALAPRQRPAMAAWPDQASIGSGVARQPGVYNSPKPLKWTPSAPRSDPPSS